LLLGILLVYHGLVLLGSVLNVGVLEACACVEAAVRVVRSFGTFGGGLRRGRGVGLV